MIYDLKLLLSYKYSPRFLGESSLRKIPQNSNVERFEHTAKVNHPNIRFSAMALGSAEVNETVNYPGKLSGNSLISGSCLPPDEPCEKTYCSWGATCVVSENGKPLCQCPTDCPSTSEPVCGSDNVTYTNYCHLRKTSCLERKTTRVKNQGVCASEVCGKLIARQRRRISDTPGVKAIVQQRPKKNRRRDFSRQSILTPRPTIDFYGIKPTHFPLDSTSAYSPDCACSPIQAGNIGKHEFHFHKDSTTSYRKTLVVRDTNAGPTHPAFMYLPPNCPVSLMFYLAVSKWQHGQGIVTPLDGRVQMRSPDSGGGWPTNTLARKWVLTVSKSFAVDPQPVAKPLSPPELTRPRPISQNVPLLSPAWELFMDVQTSRGHLRKRVVAYRWTRLSKINE
ncbi:Agrin [Melipona quadrifasciata]|uniref:Agrin n=1 Tax=Melipona quadrifasciata TaxID=166423 RepID=A0A0M8ZZU8_9HYME|nr:Agrin [Melipona quadrifasciata]